MGLKNVFYEIESILSRGDELNFEMRDLGSGYIIITVPPILMGVARVSGGLHPGSNKSANCMITWVTLELTHSLWWNLEGPHHVFRECGVIK